MESIVRDAKWYFSKHLKLELMQEKTRVEDGCYLPSIQTAHTVYAIRPRTKTNSSRCGS
jgi:hypothetical protein